MLSMSNLTGNLKWIYGRSQLFAMRHGPTILMGVGAVGVVASTIMACNATLKVNEVLAETKPDLDNIHSVHNDPSKAEKYPEEAYRSDLAKVYVRRGVSLAKLYAPAAIIGGISLACMIGSHIILRKRNIALVAAYKIIDDSFKEYRKRVVEEHGSHVDYAYRHGLDYETISKVETDEEGNEIGKRLVGVDFVEREDAINHNYDRKFDRNNIHFQKNMGDNLTFLKCAENEANDRLHTYGHLFLNDAYKLCGIHEPSVAGQEVGWWLHGKNDDSYIDFDLMNPRNEWHNNAYENPEDKVIYLSFNVDGPIKEMLPLF